MQLLVLLTALLMEFIHWEESYLGLIFFNTWFTDFFSQNIQVRGGKKNRNKITKKNFFI